MGAIDADAHVEESTSTWEHLDGAWRTHRPVPVAFPEDTCLGDFNAAWLIGGRIRHMGGTPTSARVASKKGVSIGSQELADVGARLCDLDRLGIDKQVVFPTLWLTCVAEDVALEAALARSYNAFMADRCGRSDGRLFYSALLPFRSPSLAIEELRRAKAAGGVAGVFARGMEWDRPLSDPAFLPIYDEARRLGVAITVHIGAGSPSMDRLFEGIPRRRDEIFPFVPPRALGLRRLLIPFAFETLMNAAVPAELPGLRWVFLEAGSEWLCSSVRALTRAGHATWSASLARGEVYVGAQPDEDLGYVTKRFGSDLLVLASDFPHMDAFRQDRFEDAVRRREDLDEGTKEKLLQANAARLYGL
jgi:predicted TIM-barrel fold metal-dependent hydrolase